MKNNKIFKNLIVFLMFLLILLSIGCQKKVKRRWVEVGADPNPPAMEPGVHPERGSVSDAVQIYLAPIYYPEGLDINGQPQYKKYLYELLEVTPTTINNAMVELGLISGNSLFCDLVIEDSDVQLNAGPGVENNTLSKKGTIRYVDLSSNVSNNHNYQDKKSNKDLVGMIDMNDVIHCICKTFEENFQLVSCEVEPIGIDTYNQIKGIVD